jgi:hypothetical protein
MGKSLNTRQLAFTYLIYIEAGTGVGEQAIKPAVARLPLQDGPAPSMFVPLFENPYSRIPIEGADAKVGRNGIEWFCNGGKRQRR